MEASRTGPEARPQNATGVAVQTVNLPAAPPPAVPAAWLAVLLTIGLAVETLGRGPAAWAFDLTRHNIPVEQILDGGPPKDGIPALSAPATVPAERAAFLRPTDRVVGVRVGDAARAYPLAILNWHEAVNDTLGGTPILVTYCPLTDSAVVFDRVVEDRIEEFGVSGRLYLSNVLLYDRRSESLWSQLGSQAVTGERTGTELEARPTTVTTWGEWARTHPLTTVLSDATGYERDYRRDPYASYHRAPGPAFPIEGMDARLPAKARVLGLRLRRVSRAYPIAELARVGRVEDVVSGTPVVVAYDAGQGSATVTDARTGRFLPATSVYWFAWSGFHPDTAVWGNPQPPTPMRPPGVPVGTADGSAAIDIVRHRAYWTSLLELVHRVVGDAAEAPKLLVIRGELRNVSSRPLHHVELIYELLDDAGTVVASKRGFNFAGEALRPVEGDQMVVGPNVRILDATAPVMPGDVDVFRMIFISDEIPAFAAYRVRIISAPRQ